MARQISVKKQRDLARALRLGKKFYLGTTNSGSYSNISGGVSIPTGSAPTAGTPWFSATKPTVVANQWNLMSNGGVLPLAGRTICISSIKVTVTDPCLIGYRVLESGSSYNLGGAGQYFLAGTFADDIYKMEVAGTREFTFEPGKFMVKAGQQINFLYSTSTTTGTNWQIIVEGTEITDDNNFGALLEQGVIGDSICINSDAGEMQYTLRSGAIHGVWPFIINRTMRDVGIDCLLTNIGVGGSNTTYWELRVAQGLFNEWKPDLLHCNLGINDAASAGYISTVSGTDGTFKIAYKSIITGYFRDVPGGCFIANQVTDTNSAAQITTISGGMYNGLTQIAAIRLELIALIGELQALHPTWDLKLADTSPGQTYTAADTTNYLTSEQAGTRIHPNARLGQPKMANPIIEALKFTIFFNKYKTN